MKVTRKTMVNTKNTKMKLVKKVVKSKVTEISGEKKTKLSKAKTMKDKKNKSVKAEVDALVTEKIASPDTKRKTRKSRKISALTDENSTTEVNLTIDNDDHKSKLEVSEKPVKKGKKMIVLSTINDISEVTKLHEKWQEYLSSPLIVIDASAVERMDTAVLQLLTTLVKSADENQVKVEWQGATEPLKHAVKLLGLNGPLKLH